MPVRGSHSGREIQGLGPVPHLDFGSSTAPGVWQVLSELLPLKPPGEPREGARCVCEVSCPVWDKEWHLTLILQIQF